MKYSKIIEAIKAEAEQTKTAFYSYIRRSEDDQKRTQSRTRSE